MSDDDDTWRAVLEDTHEAVLKYAALELDALARRVILALQRLEASGIYGDDYHFKSVWDEYCHDIQRGPSPFLEQTWEETIGCGIKYAIERLQRPVGLLISIGANYELDGFEYMSAVFAPDSIRVAVKRRIDRAANRRQMERFYAY